MTTVATRPGSLGAWVKRTTVESAIRYLGPPLRARGARPVRPDAIRRLLILQLQNVGDTIIFARALQAIRRRYPVARIDILANAVSAQVYKRCPIVDRVWIDPARGSAAGGLPPLSLLRQVRAQRYDAVLADVTQQSLRYATIAALCGAPLRVGFDVDGRGFLFNHPLTVAAGETYVECNLALAAAMDADAEGTAETFWFDETDRVVADALLAQAGVRAGEPLVVVHPASNWQSKTWYVDRWAAVADRLAAGAQAKIVFVGTRKDAECAEEIRVAMHAPSASLCGRTDLPELAAVLARATLFLGTDSGPRHIAGALGVPQVTVMSSLDYPHRWGLDRPRETVLRTDPECSGCQLSVCSHRRCMDLIDADRVAEACFSLMPSR